MTRCLEGGQELALRVDVERVDAFLREAEAAKARLPFRIACNARRGQLIAGGIEAAFGPFDLTP